MLMLSGQRKKKTPKAAVDSECLKAAVGLLTYISGT
jgi:hypothetical protein